MIEVKDDNDSTDKSERVGINVNHEEETSSKKRKRDK